MQNRNRKQHRHKLYDMICYVRRPRLKHTVGAFAESEMTVTRFNVCSDTERLSVGSGVSFFQQLGIITDHAERNRAAECLFIY